MQMKVLSLLAALLSVNHVTANKRLMEIIRESMETLEAEDHFFTRAFEHESVLGAPRKCKNGSVNVGGEKFSCENVDFYSFVAMKDLEIREPAHHDTLGASAADIWGWLSPTGREFTFIALDNGVVAVDGTDPAHPCIMAKMPTRRVVDKWGDVKIFDNTLYHVKDTSVADAGDLASYGMEVYDLLPLDQLDCSVDGFIPLMLWPHFVVEDYGQAHNLVVDPPSKRLYTVGTEKCGRGGIMIYDVATDRLKPTLIGCADGDGYTHDAQCLEYDGPDKRYTGKQICFGFNEDSLTIWDVTDAANPIMVSRTEYLNQAYSHQGWVNDKLTLILLDDELDEVCNADIDNHWRCDFAHNLNGVTSTTTDVFNITDLEKPEMVGVFDHEDLSIDHNLYVWGTIHRKGWGGNKAMEHYPDPNYAYMNNYLAGIKIVDIHSEDVTQWKTVGSFDVAPEKTELSFAGAWSGYMHPSGVYAISSIERGLFFVQPTMAYTTDFPKANGEITGPVGGDAGGNEEDDDKEDIPLTLPIIAILLVVGTVVVAAYLEVQKKRKELAESQQASDQQLSDHPNPNGNQSSHVGTKNAMFNEDEEADKEKDSARV